MMTVENILAEAQRLLPAEQVRLYELLAQQARIAEIEARREAIRQAKGSMAGWLPTTEEFLAEKHTELAAEMDRNGQ